MDWTTLPPSASHNEFTLTGKEVHTESQVQPQSIRTATVRPSRGDRRCIFSGQTRSFVKGSPRRHHLLPPPQTAKIKFAEQLSTFARIHKSRRALRNFRAFLAHVDPPSNIVAGGGGGAAKTATEARSSLKNFTRNSNRGDKLISSRHFPLRAPPPSLLPLHIIRNSRTQIRGGRELPVQKISILPTVEIDGVRGDGTPPKYVYMKRG